MKLWLVSDLHTDVHSWRPERTPEHDVMVIAGDISDSVDGADLMLRALHIRTRRPIVFVPGNHDFFGQCLGDFGVHIEGVHVLEPGAAVIIGGVRFVGSTMWTDWQLGDKEFQAQAWAGRHMPEYSHVVRDDGELIWPIDIYAEHQRHRAAIDELLSVPHDGPTVVVTHHAPSLQSVHPGDRTDVSAAAYASDLEGLIVRHRPELWVHGHIHHASDYAVGDTRVVCNPRGYQSESWAERTGWDETLVVEV